MLKKKCIQHIFGHSQHKENIVFGSPKNFEHVSEISYALKYDFFTDWGYVPRGQKNALLSQLKYKFLV